eukprot:SM000174S03363  [mRNA]  locus=s174:193768:194898:+ [translate_table: standard]
MLGRRLPPAAATAGSESSAAATTAHAQVVPAGLATVLPQPAIAIAAPAVILEGSCMLAAVSSRDVKAPDDWLACGEAPAAEASSCSGRLTGDFPGSRGAELGVSAEEWKSSDDAGGGGERTAATAAMRGLDCGVDAVVRATDKSAALAAERTAECMEEEPVVPVAWPLEAEQLDEQSALLSRLTLAESLLPHDSGGSHAEAHARPSTEAGAAQAEAHADHGHGVERINTAAVRESLRRQGLDVGMLPGQWPRAETAGMDAAAVAAARRAFLHQRQKVHPEPETVDEDGLPRRLSGGDSRQSDHK